MTSVITLTTDFGIADTYVGAIKGAILSVNPEVTIIDITHNIEPQNILQAAYSLNNVYRYFPKKSIHLAVVDPGVGSRRNGVILKTADALFVAPDNGVLSYVINDLLVDENAVEGNPQMLTEVKLCEGLEAVVITDPRFWRQPISSTFHARDIFAPVAAGLSLGISIYEFGEKLNSLHVFPTRRPHMDEDGHLIGQVIWIDRFGNLVTNIKGTDLLRRDVQFEIRGHLLYGLYYYYEEADGLAAVLGSNGQVEIALTNGNACDSLDAQIGDQVIASPC